MPCLRTLTKACECENECGWQIVKEGLSKGNDKECPLINCNMQLA